jgi:hypothetical protein
MKQPSWLAKTAAPVVVGTAIKASYLAKNAVAAVSAASVDGATLVGDVESPPPPPQAPNKAAVAIAEHLNAKFFMVL